MTVSALSADFYELTMMQGYYLTKNNPYVVFDMFYRSNPFNGGYVVFAGINDLLKRIELFTFSKSDIEFLRSLNRFDNSFLNYLADFKFTGTIYAVDEGTIVFPGEPLIRVEGTMLEAQLIEGILLNTINYQSLIATKASRIYKLLHKEKLWSLALGALKDQMEQLVHQEHLLSVAVLRRATL